MIPFIKKYWVFLLSVSLFLISLTQTAFCGKRTQCPDGAFALIGGIFALLGSPCAIPWLANPLLFLSWYWFYQTPKRALYSIIAALLCACSFLLFERALVSSAGDAVITSYEVGYWLWIGSILILLIGIVATKFSAQKK